MPTPVRTLLLIGMVALGPILFRASIACAQTIQSPALATLEQPDAERTRQELSALLDRYPPTLHSVLALDPALLGDQSYLAPYPALVSFLNTHPEVARNPAFYIGQDVAARVTHDHASQILDMWTNVIAGIGIFAGFAMGIGLLVWLIRTLVDYRRWTRLAKVQADVHTKILDRFTDNQELLAYIQSQAGAKFLQSSPIALNIAPQSVGAPLGRILWSVQGGIVLLAGGIGMQVVSGKLGDNAAEPLHVLGILGIALGIGFVISAIISFVISQRLRLIDLAVRPARTEIPAA